MPQANSPSTRASVLDERREEVDAGCQRVCDTQAGSNDVACSRHAGSPRRPLRQLHQGLMPAWTGCCLRTPEATASVSPPCSFISTPMSQYSIICCECDFPDQQQGVAHLVHHFSTPLCSHQPTFLLPSAPPASLAMLYDCQGPTWPCMAARISLATRGGTHLPAGQSLRSKRRPACQAGRCPAA